MATVNSTSPTRLTGMATGLDTDQLVKEMLTAQQTKIDAVQQKQTLTEWKQEEYRGIIEEAKELYSKYFDPLSKDYLLSSSSLSSMTVTSSDNLVISATASGGALPINYNFEVQSTATSAQMVSTTSLSKTDILLDLGFTGETTFRINYGDAQSTEPITITEDDTIESLVSKINAASDGNIKATFSEMTGKLTISTSDIGANSNISISNGIVDIDGNFVEDGSSNALSFLGINGNKTNGQNAKVIVRDTNGNLVKEIDSETNSFTIDGITYNVNGVGNARLTSTTDTTRAVDKMKAFVEDYNSLVSRINGKLKEEKNSDYAPLTDAQKAEMSKEEIEKWEEKAKQGMLRGDTELRNMLNNLTNAISGSLAEFGISLSSDYTKSGQLVLDEEKFSNALIEKGDKVASAVQSSLGGVQTVLKNNVGSSSSILIKKAGLKNTSAYSNNTFSNEIKRYEEKIQALNKKLTAKENALYKKFAALESIMNKYNNQINYLTNI